MKPIAYIRIALPILIIACGPPNRVQAQNVEGTTGDAPTMNLLVHGINSRGTDMFGEVGTIRQQGTTYRIELVNENRPTNDRGIFQYMNAGIGDPGADPQGTKVIRVRDPNDPNLKKFIDRIANEPHATVAIDMDLTVTFVDPVRRDQETGNWRTQTDAAAKIAVELGQARAVAHPDSQNTLFAHSAGTVALSKVIDSGNGQLFQTKIAASPMTWSLSKDVLIMQAAGDLPATPTGAIGDLKLRNTPTRDADGWLNHGNTVVRISNPGLNVAPSSFVNPITAHTESHELNVDHNVQLLVPVSEQKPGEPPSPMHVEKYEVANVVPGQVVRLLGSHAGSPEAMSPTDAAKLRGAIEQLEPPKGGGIALKATAVLPIDPASLAAAQWDDASRRIVLIAKDGAKWQLPPMDPEIARAAYQCVFAPGEIDPEFSIGAPLQNDTSDKAAAGKEPCYYKGPVQDTLLGLILFRADSALGDIAYGGTKELAERHLNTIPGFHSLPEMFPAKYADQPARENYLGVGERVVIEALPAKLVQAGNDTLAYAAVPELSVRFGRTTPAERGFADLFGAYYSTLVQRVPEFSYLVECSRAVGVLKWIRQHEVPFQSVGSLAQMPQAALTPHQVDFSRSVKLQDLAPARPLVLYGLDGPTEIYKEAGPPIEVKYFNGRIHQVVRPDGRILDVRLDSLGQPIAMEIQTVGACVFVRETEDYFNCVENVDLQVRDGTIAGFHSRTSSHALPEADPWEAVDAIAGNFIAEK